MDKCKNCGTELEPQKPGEPRKPCPKCGSMARIISETITDGTELSAIAKDTVKKEK